MKCLCTALVLCSLCLPFLPACKKEKDVQPFKPTAPVTPTVDDFSYSGSLRQSDSIVFSVSPCDTAQFLWNFGDGGSATTAKATHVYMNSGVYTVSVTPCGDITRQVVKTITISENTFLSYLISGMKTWHRIKYHIEDYYTGSVTTETILPDTSFGINYVDSAKISLLYRVLTYDKWLSNDTLASFSWVYSDLGSGGFTRLYYNKQSHKMECTDQFGYVATSTKTIHDKTVYTTD